MREPKFKIGDLVSSYYAKGTYMPGVGEVTEVHQVQINCCSETDYVYFCAHNGREYRFREDEIVIHDYYY